jgi:hypothetical protein
MGYGEVNYSVGVLIILLMMFWFTCKCIGNNKPKQKPIIIYRPIPQTKEPVKQPSINIKPGGLIYGGSKIRVGNDNGSSHIQLNNSVLEVPNSKTAMRDLTSVDVTKCNVNDKDNALSSMYLAKKRTENYASCPKSLTAERGLRLDSFEALKPMDSY